MIRSVSTLIALSALAALAGCSPGGTGEVKLGVDVAALRGVAEDSAAASDVWSEAGLSITRVRILVAEAKVGYAGDPDGEESAHAGPFVVDLSADEITGGAYREFSLGELPAGTYGGAEIEIEPLGSDADTSDEALADFVAEGASLLVDGAYQGQTFRLAGHFLAEQGTDGEVTIEEGVPVALTLTVDPSTWFLDASGAVIDPTIAAQQPDLAVAICETLDTQEQSAPMGPPPGDCDKDGGEGGAHPEGMGEGGAPPPPEGMGGAPPEGMGGGKKGPPKGGPKGGGQGPHCVEPAATTG